MTYRAVIFDLFETLVHAQPTDRRADALALIAQAGVPATAWRRHWSGSNAIAYRNPITLQQRVAAALRLAGMKSPASAFVTQVAGLLQARFIPELLPDVPGALAALRDRGYRLGLISNIGTDERFALEAFELPALLDDCVISYEVGLAKPDPEIFALAAERLEVEPTECVFVDDVAAYLAGAKQVGMTTVLIARPERVGAPQEGERDLRIEGLQELVEWLPADAGQERS